MTGSIAIKDVTSSKEKISFSPPAEVYVGKDILELLSSSMYVNPLTMFREYIQNATDSIDEAVKAKVLSHDALGKVEIGLYVTERKIIVRDNGMGIPAAQFKKLMSSFGSSKKKGLDARGFRGVGRFSGLAFCQTLTFRSKAKGEDYVSEMRWDGRQLKKSLKDENEISLEQLVKNVAQFSQTKANDLSESFFEVELDKVIRIKNDVLLNEKEVYDYLSQNSPVGLEPGFKFKKEIEQRLSQYGVKFEYQILISNDFSDSQMVYRPYNNQFRLNKTTSDSIEGYELLELHGVEGDLSAILLVYEHSYKGVIPHSENVKGIRVRVGNIQIGDEKLLTEVFPESRFNSWSIGELHILDRKVIPNGRRDNFESSIHWEEIQNKLTPAFHKIARTCRINSSVRNAVKQFELLDLKCGEILEILNEGAIPDATRGEYVASAEQLISELLKISSNSNLSEKIKDRYRKVLRARAKELEATREGLPSSGNLLDQIPKRKQRVYSELIHEIYDLVPEKKFADELIERLLKRAIGY